MGTSELSGKLNVMPRGNLVIGLASHIVVSYPGAGIILILLNSDRMGYLARVQTLPLHPIIVT